MSPGPIARSTGLAAAVAAAAAAAGAVLLRRRSGGAAGAPSPGAPVAAGVPAAASGPSERDGAGPLSMNEVSFEQLRGLGLSITQARRFLAVREERGGFDSPDDLDEVVGFPKDLRERLREQLRA